VNVDTRDDDERTPLFMAVDLQNLEITKLLLTFNADPNIKAYLDGRSILDVAVLRGSYNIVKELLRHNANTIHVILSDEQKDKEIVTSPICKAVKKKAMKNYLNYYMNIVILKKRRSANIYST